MDANDPCPLGMRGIVPSLNTPFTDDDAIDRAGVARLTEATVAAGAAGMLILAVAGEQGKLSAAEKETVGRIVVERAGARIPVVMSVTAAEAAQSRALAALARAIGADGVCCQAPAGLSGAALEDAIARIADAGPDLFMLQDLDWGGSGLPIDAIARLFARVPQFRALKVETVPAGPKYTRVLAATGGRLHVSGGWAVSQMPEALARGVHAFMPTALDHVYVRIHRLWHAGREAEARAWFERLLPVLAFTQQHIDVSIRFLKHLRHRQGIFATDRCRVPPPLDGFQAAEMARLVPRAQALDAAAQAEAARDTMRGETQEDARC
jgi:4-hydroxy-tetrahydrodipicolinate synthase